MAALASWSVMLFLFTRGFADLAIHCDAISPFHLAVFAWGAIGVGVLAAQRPRPWAFQMVWFAGIGAGALGHRLRRRAAMRRAARSPGSTRWSTNTGITNIAEGLPVWQQPVATMLGIVVPPAVGLFAALRLARRRAASGCGASGSITRC